MSPATDALNRLGTDFDRHLTACSAMAGVSALAAALALSPGADAAIIYTPVGKAIPKGYILTLDITSGTYIFGKVGTKGGAGDEFYMVNSAVTKLPFTAFGGVTAKDFVMYSPEIYAAYGTSPAFYYTNNVPKGKTISLSYFGAGASGPVGYPTAMYYGGKAFSGGPSKLGEFTSPPKSATGNYIAISFEGSKAGSYYLGWVSVTLSGYTPTIKGFAWETVAGKSIVAGAVPEPASMGLAALAIGASGLAAWRRRREQGVEGAVATEQ